MSSRFVFMSAVTILCMSAVSQAEQVSYEINAVIDQIIDPGKLLAGQVKKGDILKGMYTFDTKAVDTDSSPQYGHFDQLNENNGFSLRMNKLVSKKPTSHHNLFHTIDISNGKTDYFYIESMTELPLGNDLMIRNISLEIFDYTGSAINSDALSPEPPEITHAEDKNVLFSGTKVNTHNDFDVKAHITSIRRIDNVAEKQ